VFPGQRKANGQFVGIGSDVTRNASILVDDVKANGIIITNAELVVLCDNRAKEARCAEAPRTHLIVAPTNTGTIKLVNAALWGPARQAAKVEGSGAVSFTDTLLLAWGCGVDTPPCLEPCGCEANATAADPLYAMDFGGNGTATVRGSDFRQPSSHQVRLGPMLKRAIVADNLCAGEVGILRESNTTRVAIHDNVY
jgi:hypothetical protein